jgi:hypothetical protein
MKLRLRFLRHDGIYRSDVVNKPSNPGAGCRLPLVGPGAQSKDATGGTARPTHRPRRVPAGYSSIGLLASIARLRFTGKTILKPFRDGAQ